MILPKKWGQGQIFAFSALDGPSYAGDDFVGTLSGDRIGIRFHSNTKRELAFVNVKDRGTEFDAVTSDYICFRTLPHKKTRILYADRHLVIGDAQGSAHPIVFTEGSCRTETVGKTEIQDTRDGDVTALRWENGRFAFAFGHSGQEVLELVERGLSMDLDAEEARKRQFYRSLSVTDDFPYAQLYRKCASVMKTQLYSPEAEFTTIWSTPDRVPHVNLWLWDSVFHALGHRHISESIAEDLIRAVWVHQSESGFIPHMGNIHRMSAIIQPPIIAWGVWQLYQQSHNKLFLEEAYLRNRRFLNWCREHRRQSDKELYTWKTASDRNCRCDECGMDNSPRFDAKALLYAIDFSCFMANDVRYMQKIAAELGRGEEARFYEAWRAAILADINETLWCEEDGFYFDYDISRQDFHKVWSVASFLPLFAGVCSEQQAEHLAQHLTDPASFGTKVPVPSISQKDSTFGSDMWRGPVWINYNYMILDGLAQYGYRELGRKIADQTISMVDRWYQTAGTIYEFYDSNDNTAPNRLNRKGPAFEPYNTDVRMQSIRDYGWSCTLISDLLHRKWEDTQRKQRNEAKKGENDEVCKR